MTLKELSDRERKVLEAVVQSYIETAEPAGSRTIARRFGLGVSAATIRNTMSDLEDRGYLFHPHTSAGRIPTDLAYRFYLDRLMAPSSLAPGEHERLERELTSSGTAIEGILKTAARVLGVLTQELGVAVAPSLDKAVLDRLELVPVASDRLLLVLVLKGGAARTIFVEAASSLPDEAVVRVARVLHDRLHGLTLREIRASLRERLRDTASGSADTELLNIFVQEADHLFEDPGQDLQDLVLGSAQLLADQPEFSSNEQMRALLELTERRDVLREALKARHGASGITVTIGGEHADPKLNAFTIVTSNYRRGALSGVIGVMGPTRMPYRKVLALVEHTSRLVGDLLDESSRPPV
jgi:heat-inducible transcriptional repressor